MSQHAGEVHPHNNVEDTRHEVIKTDTSLTPPVWPYTPRAWPDDVRAITLEV